MTSRRIALAAVAAAAALLVLGAHAHAGGHVLRLDGDDIYVDLGARDGVGAGTRLILYHVVVARNPVTGQVLRDRFALGDLTVRKAGEHLAVAVAPADIKHRIAVGDQVELGSPAQVFVDPWQQRIAAREAMLAARASSGAGSGPGTGTGHAPAPAAQGSTQGSAQAEQPDRGAAAAAEAALATWQETLGKAPEARIEIWQAYLRAHPRSPYASEVAREVDSLNAQRAAEARLRAALASPADAAARRARMRVAQLAALEDELPALDKILIGRAPAQVTEGAAVPLAFVVLTPGEMDRAWLYYRHQGERDFRRADLRPSGDVYLHAAIPADATRTPGVEYFVEIAGKGRASTPVSVLGSQREPLRIAVTRAVEEAPASIDDRSRVTLFMDYVDFDGSLGTGFDQYLHAEVDFMYRFVWPVYAVRVGFGTLGGIGGPKDIIDIGDDCRDAAGRYSCRRVDYNYAYAELEYRFSDAVAVLLRPQVGHGSNDRRLAGERGRCSGADREDCELFTGMGLRGRIRFGDERTTNLTLGLGITQNVGTLFEAAYTWSVIPRFPVKLSAQVTDQPVPEDFGVRLITDIGWRAVDWVYPSVRISYQARDVDHSGISGGLAANFDW